MRLVLDASVCLKWFLSEHAHEPDTDSAFALLEDVRSEKIRLIQPPIWHSEIAAVLARMLPRHAQQMIDELFHLSIDIDAGEIILRSAVNLASRLDHHLFDTIYHAVAIEHATTLVTADTRYYRKAQSLGHITLLSQWRSTRISETPEKYTVGASKRRAPRQTRR